MEVVIYKAKQKEEYIYDMSLNPDVDYKILKDTRKITSLTVITPNIPIETAEKILKSIYGVSGIIGKLIPSQDFLINNSLKKFNINKIKKEIDSQGRIDKNLLSTVEQYIKGRMISIRQLINLKSFINLNTEEIIDCVQALYCERRIKMIPAVRTIKYVKNCSFCQKEPCKSCRFGFLEDDILLYAADNYNLKSIKKAVYKKINLTKPLKDFSDEFSAFIKSKKDYAILHCAPNSFEYEGIAAGAAEVIKSGGRILYTASPFEIQRAAKAFESSIRDINIGFSGSINYRLLDEDLVVDSINNNTPFYKSFDVVIFDRRFSFIDENIEDAEKMCKRAVKERGKFVIITSFVSKDKYGFSSPIIISLPVLKTKNPIPEPRIVLSRFIKGEEFYLPPLAVDIINLSLREDTGIILFVPDENTLDKVYNYLLFYERYEDTLIDISTKRYKEAILKLKRKEIKILISSDFKDVINLSSDVNVIVINSDDKVYDCETLINMCAAASSSTDKKTGEVIFVASNETERMSLAKSQIRNMNKLSWERGYLKR
ncbi:Superfamily II DNA/RNA helicase required for DNA uptake (late competence protein) [Caloramator quimbayensis]|uniref:Superfamily II DNA/RNA helicase required for DNA uptake (Late competence protein) n=1 Tax=Caloramator quimbayensis TaxID=1147123 RepID=A0A1T4WDY7_9CLOT|nr:hypothetical protein [Caloramator quimbayensis]SKA75524.1 Superfamily II DNA/RNA helicase required for DNA uptake (late competence protein) [Caloramator quimbayensis]